MKNITDSIKKFGIGFGLFILPYIPLKSQESNTLVKAGITYNLVQTEEISKNCFGIESLAEKGLGERLSIEWETGLYSSTNSESKYSKLQTNLGLKYKPFLKEGWSIGSKLALGVSSEFYNKPECVDNFERVALNKLVGLDAEKIFKNGRGINLSVSREIDRNIWRVGAKVILKPESRKRKSFPWPDF